MTRQCYKCKLIKPISEFRIDKANKNRPTNQCKTCIRIGQKTWVKNNPEKVAAINAKSKRLHGEERKKYQQNYYLIHKANIAEKRRQWWLKNRDSILDPARVAARKESSKQIEKELKHLDDNLAMHVRILEAKVGTLIERVMADEVVR